MADDKEFNVFDPDKGSNTNQSKFPQNSKDSQDFKPKKKKKRPAQSQEGYTDPPVEQTGQSEPRTEISDAVDANEQKAKDFANNMVDPKNPLDGNDSKSPIKNPSDVIPSQKDGFAPDTDVSNLHDSSQGMKDLVDKDNPDKSDDASSKSGDGAKKIEDGSKKVADGAEKAADGAMKTAEGAAQTAEGAGRILAGDVTGAADAVTGAKKTINGAKQTKDGLSEAKEGADDIKDGKDDLLGDKKKKDNDEPDELSMKDGFGELKKAFTMGAAGAGAGAGAAAFQGAMMVLEYLKFLLLQMAQAVVNAVNTVLNVIVQVGMFVANVTGITALAGTIATVATLTVTIVGATVGVVSTVQQTQVAERDSMALCQPSDDIPDATYEWAGSGEVNVQRADMIKKAWSVFEARGVSREVAAGILGNFDLESSIDPTGVETIYDEPFQIGPQKAAAQAVDFNVHDFAPDYASKFPGVAKAKYVGIGLGQWTGGRNVALRTYASDRGLLWNDIGTQLAFMFEGDSQSELSILQDIIENSTSVEDAATRFVTEYERPAASARHTEERVESAMKLFLELETIDTDKDYADSILSKMNQDTAFSNHATGTVNQDNGCGEAIKTSYTGSHSAEWSGELPAVAGHAWSPATLPSEIAKFASNPEDYGLTYGSGSGWNLTTGTPGQCVAFSHAYMQALYPGTTAPRGVNGADVAKAWADTYSGEKGGELSASPTAGAVFSYNNSGVYGHTGIVDHVFANGDILVIEQNISGVSGDNNGTPWTWGWRVITAESWQDDTIGNSSGWAFYKPTMSIVDDSTPLDDF